MHGLARLLGRVLGRLRLLRRSSEAERFFAELTGCFRELLSEIVGRCVELLLTLAAGSGLLCAILSHLFERVGQFLLPVGQISGGSAEYTTVLSNADASFVNLVGISSLQQPALSRVAAATLTTVTWCRKSKALRRAGQECPSVAAC